MSVMNDPDLKLMEQYSRSINTVMLVTKSTRDESSSILVTCIS